MGSLFKKRRGKVFLQLLSTSHSMYVSFNVVFQLHSKQSLHGIQGPYTVTWYVQGMIPRPPLSLLCLNFSLEPEGKEYELETIVRKRPVMEAWKPSLSSHHILCCPREHSTDPEIKMTPRVVDHRSLNPKAKSPFAHSVHEFILVSGLSSMPMV